MATVAHYKHGLVSAVATVAVLLQLSACSSSSGHAAADILKIVGTTDYGPVDQSLKSNDVLCGHTAEGEPGIEIKGEGTFKGVTVSWNLKWYTEPRYPEGEMWADIGDQYHDDGKPQGFTWDAQHVSFANVTLDPWNDDNSLTVSGTLACTYHS